MSSGNTSYTKEWFTENVDEFEISFRDLLTFDDGWNGGVRKTYSDDDSTEIQKKDWGKVTSWKDGEGNSGSESKDKDSNYRKNEDSNYRRDNDGNAIYREDKETDEEKVNSGRTIKKVNEYWDTSGNTPESKNKLRNWWHDLLRNNGKYVCYMILLAFSSDKESIRYFKEFGQEIEQITGNKCLVIALTSKTSIEGESWKTAIENHVKNGYSIKIANLFNVTVDKFPALLIFEDIRSPKHILYSLKNKAGEEISFIMRTISSDIQKAVSDKTNIIEFLKRETNREKISQSVKGVASSLGEKTLESVIQSLIGVAIK